MHIVHQSCEEKIYPSIALQTVIFGIFSHFMALRPGLARLIDIQQLYVGACAGTRGASIHACSKASCMPACGSDTCMRIFVAQAVCAMKYSHLAAILTILLASYGPVECPNDTYHMQEDCCGSGLLTAGVRAYGLRASCRDVSKLHDYSHSMHRCGMGRANHSCPRLTSVLASTCSPPLDFWWRPREPFSCIPRD